MLIRRIEVLTVLVQNTIPQLQEVPYNNQVMLTVSGAPAVIGIDYEVEGVDITWNALIAGFDVEAGERVVADYEYDDGSGYGNGSVYDGTDSFQNQSTMEYSLTVIETNIFPKLMHSPIISTLSCSVNNISVSIDLDFIVEGKDVTWISGTALNIGDVIYVSYKKN